MRSFHVSGGLIVRALFCALLGAVLPRVDAAEFEVLDRLSVDGYSVFRGSADIPGGSFAVGGSDLVVKGGNIGIGTAAPEQKLDIIGIMQTRRTSAADVGGTLQIGHGAYPWTLIGNQWAGGDFMVRNPAGADVMYFSQTGGNVGIGTTSPGRPLTVGDRMALINGASAIDIGQWDTVSNRIESSGRSLKITTYTGSINLGISGADNLVISNAGNVGIGTASPASARAEIVNSAASLLLLKNTSNPVDTEADVLFQLGSAPTLAGRIRSIKKLWAGDYGHAADLSLETYYSTAYNIGQVYLKSDGNVGIGTTAPGYKLQIAGTVYAGGYTTVANQLALTGGWSQNGAPYHAALQIQGSYPSMEFRSSTSNSVWLYHMAADGTMNWYNDPTSAQTANWGQMMILYPSGALTCKGNVTAPGFPVSSDERLKKNIASLEPALVSILKLRPVTFKWKKGSEGVHLGFIAQEVEKVFPEVVVTGADGIKAVEYGNLTAPLISAIQEQQKEIEELKAKVSAGIGTTGLKNKLQLGGLPEYEGNAAAIAAGLKTGDFYRSGEDVKVVY